jgi:hypothetical protein
MQLSELKWETYAPRIPYGANFEAREGTYCVLQHENYGGYDKYSLWSAPMGRGGELVGQAGDELTLQCLLHHLCNPVK